MKKKITTLLDAYVLLNGKKGVLITVPDENFESFIFANLKNKDDEKGIICTILELLYNAKPKESAIAKNIILNCASIILNDNPAYKKGFLKSIEENELY